MAYLRPHPADPIAEHIGGDRGAWGAKMGSILAASGSAIGLSGIALFASNACQHGSGASSVPYFIAPSSASP